MATVETRQPSPAALEDPLPGMLFFLPPAQHQSHCGSLSESTAREPSEARRPEATARAPAPATAGEPPASPLQTAPPAPEASACKKQVSRDFLEARFKIQQLLEPQQYMAFLPHHIMVKIFRLLPTRSLVALKCTCCYFKFIIEYYNIRPADSRWVRDPRYRGSLQAVQEEVRERGRVPVPLAPQALLPGLALRARVLDVLPPVSEGLPWL